MQTILVQIENATGMVAVHYHTVIHPSEAIQYERALGYCVLCWRRATDSFWHCV